MRHSDAAGGLEATPENGGVDAPFGAIRGASVERSNYR